MLVGSYAINGQNVWLLVRWIESLKGPNSSHDPAEFTRLVVRRLPSSSQQ